MLSLSQLFTESHNGHTFYSFSNANGKQWLMPAHNMRTAMNLYQPSGVKGKLMKALFPYLHRTSVVNRVVHAERKNYILHKVLEDLLCKLFETNKMEFSIFCGTPCVHQKITMQISKGKRIFGYCKFSDNEEIINIFQKEKETLNYLWQQGVKTVPKCLYCGNTENNIGLFVQTTTKSIHSITDHEWNTREEDFLKELYDKTKQKLPFKQTDFYQDIRFLDEHTIWFTDIYRTEIQKGISKVMSYFSNNEVKYSFYHGDFTPWNMYIEKGKLFVFDLEYAKYSYPPYLDYFHFFTQTSIFEKHLNADEIWNLYQKEKNKITHLFQDTDFAYLSYLLSIITHYTRRENSSFTGDVLQCIKLWGNLIRHINNQQ